MAKYISMIMSIVLQIITLKPYICLCTIKLHKILQYNNNNKYLYSGFLWNNSKLHKIIQNELSCAISTYLHHLYFSMSQWPNN